MWCVVLSRSFSARLDLVLAGLAVLLDAVQLLHRLAADVAHRHPGVLALGLGLLDQFAAALLGQLRNGDADDVAVVGRVDAEVGVADRVLDVRNWDCSYGLMTTSRASGTLMLDSWVIGVDEP